MLVESPIRIAKKALLGTMLGDGSLRINSQGTQASFQGNHSVNQLPYLIWKLHLLVPVLGPVDMRLRYVYADKRKNYVAVRYHSLQSVYLKHIYNDFYFVRDGKVKKEVHMNVLNRLDPIALALWYQDDGGVQSRNGHTISSISLAVCGFSDKEIELICEYFSKVWLIDWKAKPVRDQYWVLVCSGDSMRSFIEIIRPHMCPWMTYKINSSDSAKHLSIEEGDDMIRSFEQSKELNGNIQLHNEETITFDDDDLSIIEFSKFLVPYGIALSDVEKQEYQSLVLSSSPQWRKMINSNGESWYLFLHTNSNKLVYLRKKFGGYIRSYGNNAEYRIGGKSAYRMCDVLNLEKIVPHNYV